MRLSCIGAISLFVILAASSPLAKGTVSRITIDGRDLTSPIEIDDPKVAGSFNVWAGAGAVRGRGGVEETEGFIIDWASGAVAAPRPELRRYMVSFFVWNPPRTVEKLVYIVFYTYDSSTQQGYVYLPGKGDKEYRLNVSTILRMREGNWFLATASWQSVVAPLIASGNPK
jgi:hypothetical protein